MKVGIIGLGRMGEGMSRRMIKAGIEVHGYRNNVQKANEQFEKGYISGYATSLESLVQVVHSQKSIYGEKSGETIITKAPGVFMMVVPAETVEETLNELLQFCVEGDIIIDHGNSNFKDSRQRAERLAKLGINILTVGLAVVSTVWIVDTVLWLVVQLAQYPLALQSLGHSHQVSDLPLVRTLSTMKPAASMVGTLWTTRCWTLCEDGSQWYRVWYHASIC